MYHDICQGSVLSLNSVISRMKKNHNGKKMYTSPSEYQDYLVPSSNACLPINSGPNSRRVVDQLVDDNPDNGTERKLITSNPINQFHESINHPLIRWNHTKQIDDCGILLSETQNPAANRHHPPRQAECFLSRGYFRRARASCLVYLLSCFVTGCYIATCCFPSPLNSSVLGISV